MLFCQSSYLACRSTDFQIHNSGRKLLKQKVQKMKAVGKASPEECRDFVLFKSLLNNGHRYMSDVKREKLVLF